MTIIKMNKLRKLRRVGNNTRRLTTTEDKRINNPKYKRSQLQKFLNTGNITQYLKKRKKQKRKLGFLWFLRP